MFNRWFQGRYGVDQLSRALIIASLIVSVISWFFGRAPAGVDWTNQPCRSSGAGHLGAGFLHQCLPLHPCGKHRRNPAGSPTQQNLEASEADRRNLLELGDSHLFVHPLSQATLVHRCGLWHRPDDRPPPDFLPSALLLPDPSFPFLFCLTSVKSKGPQQSAAVLF